MQPVNSIQIQFWGLVLLASLPAPSGRAEAGSPTNRPNVLWIMVDDLNTRLGCYGHQEVKSPNIDALARIGVRFEHAYNHYPICNPSRTALLSGRRPGTTRIIDNDTPPRRYLEGVTLLPEYFREHGYFTARIGKIAHGPYESAVKWDVSLNPVRGPKTRWGKRLWVVTNNEDEKEPDGATAPRILDLLEKHKGKPFFVAAGFDKPHLPLVAPKKYYDLYPVQTISLPNEPSGVRRNVPFVAFGLRGGPWKNAAEHRQLIAAYYACVSFIDAQVGILVDGLKRLGLLENTIICFTSDHGFHLGEHGGLWRKSTLFEESARVPLIVVAPGGAKAGSVCPRIIEHVDLFPTLAELCGLGLPVGLEGRSFAPLLKDPLAAWDKPAITVFVRETVLGNVVGQSLRTERWRYTEWDGGRRGTELYDHHHDPREWTNVANRAQYAPIMAELKGLLLLRMTATPPVVAPPVAARPYLLTGAGVGVLVILLLWRRLARAKTIPPQ